MSEVERQLVLGQGDIQARPKLKKFSPRVTEGDLYDSVASDNATKERRGLINMRVGSLVQRDLILTLHREKYPHASQRYEAPLLATKGSYVRDDMAKLRRTGPVPKPHEDLAIAYREVVEAFTEDSLIIEQVL